MLQNVSGLMGVKVEARDGEVGRVDDIYFDDDWWVIRYLILDMGNWLRSKKVLISPVAIDYDKWVSDSVPLDLTRNQLKEAPPWDMNKPVSRRYEEAYHDYFNWPYYWGAPAVWGFGGYPWSLLNTEGAESPAKHEVHLESGDPHLRSAGEVLGYRVHATDGDIGHISDLLFDDSNWRIRYVVVDTRVWLPGKRVVISPEWILMIDWEDKHAHVDLSQEDVRSSPEYDPEFPPTREYEKLLHEHYGREAYWTRETETSERKKGSE